MFIAVVLSTFTLLCNGFAELFSSYPIRTARILNSKHLLPSTPRKSPIFCLHEFDCLDTCNKQNHTACVFCNWSIAFTNVPRVCPYCRLGSSSLGNFTRGNSQYRSRRPFLPEDSPEWPGLKTDLNISYAKERWIFKTFRINGGIL